MTILRNTRPRLVRRAVTAGLLAASLVTAACATAPAGGPARRAAPAAHAAYGADDVRTAYDLGLTCWGLGRVAMTVGRDYGDRRLAHAGERIMRGSAGLVAGAASVLRIPSHRWQAEQEVVFDRYLLMISVERDPVGALLRHMAECHEIVA